MDCSRGLLISYCIQLQNLCTHLKLFDDGKHSMESDIYAFGILLWEMVTHEVPYEGLSGPQIMSRVDKNQVQ